jgi:hypothetical protein
MIQSPKLERRKGFSPEENWMHVNYFTRSLAGLT